MPIRSALRAATTGLAVFALVFQPGLASAAKKRSRDKSSLSSKKSSGRSSSGRKTMALGAFTGWKADELRDWVKDALAGTVTITDAEDAKLKKPADFARVASELSVDTVAVGRQRTGRMELTVRDADGQLVKVITVTGKRGPKLKAAIEEELPKALSKALGTVESSAAPEQPEPTRAAEPEPEPSEERASTEDREAAEDEGASASEDTESSEDEEEKDEEAADEAKRPAEPRPSTRGGIGAPFVIDLGGRFQNRGLRYHDQPDGPRPPGAFALQDHSLKLGSLLVLNLGVYGNLFVDEGFLANLGLVGGFEFGPSVPSKYTGTQTELYPSELKNKTQEWYVGPRFRIPIGAHELGLGLAYGKHSFEIAGDEEAPLILDTAYGYLRPSADAWFSLGDLFLGVDLGFRYVLGAGKLADEWFPKASGLGVDAGVHLGYELSSLFSVVVGADYTRYALTLNPDKATATRVAGSALDQYISGYLGVRFTFGSGGASGATAAAIKTPEADSDSDSESDQSEPDDSEPESDSESEGE